MATEITKQVFVSEEAFGNNKYAILPSKLPIRSDQSITIIPYIHFNTATNLVDSTLLILLFQKCWKLSKNIFSSVKKKIVKENIESLRIFYLPKWRFKKLINHLTDMCWSCQAKVLYHATKYGDCKSDVVDFRLVLCKNGYCCWLGTIMSPALFVIYWLCL